MFEHAEVLTGEFGIQIDPWWIIFLAGGVSAALGLFVASLAYRGYVRNDSVPMFYLTIGIAFLTTVPFFVSYGVDWVLSVGENIIVLLVTACHLLGLFAIFRSFRRP
ncbi:DUF7521 family protein [Halomontanus rarus]|uniref:DUF7521 family protein n=1 Tax=Halomontanus rarus TaxID=3034020 RepID=UPI0023E75F49|nr:hypothetical protein [Halovivax sp. TS33]